MSEFPKRLIEVAFPLKQASLDSVHEKNVRHGHISTLHIWPARRPLAACRAALIATLLPDPGNPEERKLILEKMAGKVVQRPRKKMGADGRMQEEMVEETEGGILHWGRESGPDLEWFRQKIREAYGGRAPKVLDPFAGGGAIPLEAMRLGCEATAVDINPVAWFILKCTLEYPQKLAGQKLPLPDFVRQDRDFMEAFLKAQGYKGKGLQTQLDKLGLQKTDAPELPGFESTVIDLSADLAWHVRAWGSWVLKQARGELGRFYPTYADFEPLVETAGKWEHRSMQLVPLDGDGRAEVERLNAEFPASYLSNKSNPRWVAKPTVAYLWARTVTCKNCRATIPLLKTRWLAKKEKKRIILIMRPDAEKKGVVFGVQANVPVQGATPAQRKAHDKEVGGGTMSRSGAACPCCGTIMTMEDIRLEGQAGRLGAVMTAVVIGGQNGKEYRLPTEEEICLDAEAEKELGAVYAQIPFGLPDEPIPQGASRRGGGSAFTAYIYGIMQWRSLFTLRQMLALGTFIKTLRCIRNTMIENNYSSNWVEVVSGLLQCTFDRMLDFNSLEVTWMPTVEAIGHTFVRFALPITWDYSEAAVINYVRGGWQMSSDASLESLETIHKASNQYAEKPFVIQQSAKISHRVSQYDVIVTDPPYYDAIPYSDLMDYFYIWMRRSLTGLAPEIDAFFSNKLGPKWDHTKQDGELIDDAGRFDGNEERSKVAYEEGMYDVFRTCHLSLTPDGRLVIVFAHKNPNAWETLVSAIIRAGFVVDGSWPIQTEQVARMRAQSSAALASSVWLVCKKRPETSRPGWDNRVFEEMRQNITSRLRDFWDAGIRGPDFVWAATGPALEAYSQYPAVKKANEPGKTLSVAEFLAHVRRMVVDFVVGRVLTGDAEVSGLDNVTAYYLLHRHDFGIKDAPAGPCILYAVSCGLTDHDLADRYDLLARRGGKESDQEDEEEEEDMEGEPEEEGSSSVFRLKAWNQRKRLGGAGEKAARSRSDGGQVMMEAPEGEYTTGQEIPLIDQVHRLMHLWKGGDVIQVDEYLDWRGLRRNALFLPLLQALIELAAEGSEERALLESISNHVGGRGTSAPKLF